MFQSTEGYSGSDIHLVCKEAAMRPLRKVFEKLEALTDSKLLNYLFYYATVFAKLKRLEGLCSKVVIKY